MRILALSPSGQYSGAESVLLRALDTGRGRGWAITVACPDGPLVSRVEDRHLSRLSIPDLKLPPGPRGIAMATFLARTAASARALRRFLRQSQPDLIVVNGVLALPALRLAAPSMPVAWLVHDVLHRRSWVQLLKATKGSVTVAVAMSEAAARSLGPVGLETTVVRLGTPWPVDPIVGRAEKPFIVGCAGMLTSWKGQDVLLEAVSSLDREDVVVELLGGHFPKDRPHVERLQARAARADLAGRVRFCGAEDDPVHRMRTWSVATSPSVEPESGPLVMLEAMSIGLPMVATNHGGPVDMLGAAGLLVPPGDPTAMASAISTLLADADRWASCHDAGPRIVAARHALPVQMKELAEQLETTARVTSKAGR